MIKRPNDPIAGIINGLLIAAVLWALIFCAIIAL